MIPPTLASSLRYHARGDPATLLADLAELGRIRERARSRRTLWIVLLVAWLVFCVIGTVASSFEEWVLGLIAAVAGGAFFIILIHRAHRLILDDRRLRLARHVVRYLGVDLHRKGEMELGVDFNHYHQAKYRTDDGGTAGHYTLSAYRLPWLVVTGDLADGARLELWTDLIAHRKERAKRKGRKKIKELIYEHVALTLRVPALPAHAPERWPELVRKAPLPPGAYLHRAAVRKGRLVLHVRTHRQVRVTNKGTVETGHDLEAKLANRHTVLGPVLATYHALAGCRRGA